MEDVLSGLPAVNGHHEFKRAGSVSQASETSQTAKDYIDSQLQLEADAREALPYKFETCTRPDGPLRQLLFSCLTCNPPPADVNAPYNAAGVCYSCSISCHGEHELVELFNKRNFVCDCGTTRLSVPCNLQANLSSGGKGDVRGEKPAQTNRYNQNFRNRFCGCGEDYNPHQEKGTMFQCLGLGTVEDGGCGEDWWHPECLVGIQRGWWKEKTTTKEVKKDVAESRDTEMQEVDEEPPLPPGFPSEEDFDGLLCYKCISANPWIKHYAGSEGFLKPVLYNPPTGFQSTTETAAGAESKKRKADDAGEDSSSTKRHRSSSPQRDTQAPPTELEEAPSTAIPTTAGLTSVPATSTESPKCVYDTLPPAPTGTFSLCLKPQFRTHLCHCSTHFPLLAAHPYLLEEEETYEPPLSESESSVHGGGSAGTKSLLDRGEAALSNMDRVRAIEGVMVYNHLRDKVKDFLKPFAETGRAVGAEDIKAYFETLRGDAEGMKAARAARSGTGAEDGDTEKQGGGANGRREQGGY